jgi:hypothetical protein
MDYFSDVQQAALTGLGIARENFDAFASGLFVSFEFPTESSPAIALASKGERRLRSGILVLNDPGGGYRTLARFRSRSIDLARSLALDELELFGAAVSNPDVERMLLRQSFSAMTIDIRLKSGDERLDVISRVFKVK